MAGSPEARAALDRFAPASHRALQNLVAAMTDVVKNTGKKSLFGKDKGLIAQEAFIKSLLQITHAMLIDGRVQKSFSGDQILDQLTSLMKVFVQGYPNWPEAELYYSWLTTDNRPATCNRLERARDVL